MRDATDFSDADRRSPQVYVFDGDKRYRGEIFKFTSRTLHVRYNGYWGRERRIFARATGKEFDGVGTITIKRADVVDHASFAATLGHKEME